MNKWASGCSSSQRTAANDETAATTAAGLSTINDPLVDVDVDVDVVVSAPVLFPDLADGPAPAHRTPAVRPRPRPAPPVPAGVDELALDTGHAHNEPAATVDGDVVGEDSDRVAVDAGWDGGSGRSAGVNKRPGLCSVCGGLVAPFTGRRTGTRNGIAVVAHTPVCPTGPG